MKVVFRADSSTNIGTGHVMRCLTLAKVLVEQGAEVHFICRDLPGNVIAVIKQQNVIVHTLKAPSDTYAYNGADQTVLEKEASELFHSSWLGVTQGQDAAESQLILSLILPDLLIVDHYAIDHVWQTMLRSYYKRLMVIDDLADRKHICDVLLDQNYGATVSKYNLLVPEQCYFLVGTEYALLRPEFAQWREYSLKRRQNNSAFKQVLITLGGVDLNNDTGKILDQLNTNNFDSNVNITIVMGAASPHLDAIVEQVKSMSVPICVKSNVTNMAELMANADIAIGAAGATTWERCCLGLPTIQLVIAENQRQIANALSKDCVVKLMTNVNDLNAIFKTASKWLNQVSEKSAMVTDGLGCQRVVTELFKNGRHDLGFFKDDSKLELVNFIDLSENDVFYVLRMRNHSEIKKWMYHQGDITEQSHLSFIESLRIEKNKEFFLAKKAQLNIGVISFTNIDIDEKKSEFGLYVNPFENIEGGGKALINLATRHAKDKLTVRTLKLEVLEDNKRAIAFYDKIGCKKVGQSINNKKAVFLYEKELFN